MKVSSRKKTRMLKRVEKRLKNAYMDLRIYLHYKSLNPNVVKLSQTDQRVSVDPTDARARKKLIVDSLRGRLPRNQLFWRRACEQLNPAVALDIGVNYGECLFSVDYPKHAQIIGIEANPFLLPHLEESQSYHKNAAQIEIHNVLAGESPSDEVSFFINQATSGESTAALGLVDANPSLYKQVSVPQIRVDDVLTENLDVVRAEDQPIVFKIDVEGYEEHVFRGMKKILAASVDMVGLIEFDLAMLQNASSDPVPFFEFLKKHFEVHLFVNKNETVPVSELSYRAFHKLLSTVKFHSDLLLIRSEVEGRYSEFIQHWQPVRMSA